MPKTKLMPSPPNHPGVYVIRCPGCGSSHHINTVVPNEDGACWGFDGDTENPTFMPSIDVAWGYLSKKATPEQVIEWRQLGMGGRCHFFVRHGVIEYLGDSTHHMAAKSCPLPCIEAERP